MESVIKTQEDIKTYYTEKHRPQFHFSPESKWMNDPNGMVYFEGEYHLFYQYYPNDTIWGPMHWEHAVSRDLVHWEHLPIALYPDDLGYIFSGSAVIDWENSSGLGTNGKAPMIAIFTYHDAVGEKEEKKDYQTQGIAYSNDKGRNWTMYEGNPVMPNTENIKDFRDPKVFWSADHKKWIMALAVQDHVRFYGSKNLIDWSYLSEFGKEFGDHGGVWECPDLFPITVEDTGEEKWVLLLSINPGGPNGGSATQYFVGNFDGKTFSLDDSFEASVQHENGVWIDYGRDNYAGVTWADVPEEDGRRLFIGWMSNWEYGQVVPTEKWRSAMTIPRVLSLRKTTEGYRIFSQPVKELEQLRKRSHTISATTLTGKMDLHQQIDIFPSRSELILEIENKDASIIGIELSNSNGEAYRIGYDASKNEYFSDRTLARNPSFSEKFVTEWRSGKRFTTQQTMHWHLFFDVASVELFADEGGTLITEIFFPNEDYDKIRIFAEGGSVQVKKGEWFELNGIWNNK